ncbi:hypothetical protein E3J74_04425 [Candidatus Bathyarchaeota archaeon]|nr:MAG: hypothetical protein E3J74_04425 [Candidatus Bathyarchaeota archaeon]
MTEKAKNKYELLHEIQEVTSERIEAIRNITKNTDSGQTENWQSFRRSQLPLHRHGEAPEMALRPYVA